MGKGKKRATNTPATYEVIGVLADETVIRTAKVEDQLMGDAVSTIAHDLQTHIDTCFALRPGITIDTSTVLIPGIAEYDPNESVADVAKQLPPDTYMTVVYSPIDSQRQYLSNAVNQMAVDQGILKVNHNAPPWPTSTSSDQKLDQLLKQIQDVSREVVQLKTDNAALKTDNAALKTDNAALIAGNAALVAGNASLSARVASLSARVDALEEENQDLRRAVDGHTTSLYKLRRRILLDQARKDILLVWAPDHPKARWTDLCAAMTMNDVRALINSKHIFRRPLLDEAFRMIYDVQSSVRLDGNDIAHEADKDLVRDAIVHGDAGPDVAILTNIFGCVYDEDLH